VKNKNTSFSATANLRAPANICFVISVFLIFSGTAGSADADDLFDHSVDKSLFGGSDLFDDGPKVRSDERPDPAAAAAALAKLQQQRALSNSMAVNDGQLFGQMRSVAAWVDNWVVFNHRFPEIGDESTYALQQLNELVPNNPYLPGSAYAVPGMTVDNAYLNNEGEQSTAMADSKVDSDRIHFVRDYGLTVSEVDEFSKDPPADWRASPGTITIITNDQYLFIVWGAGANGKPLRDLVSKRVRFAVGNYQRWDAPVMDGQVD